MVLIYDRQSTLNPNPTAYESPSLSVECEPDLNFRGERQANFGSAKIQLNNSVYYSTLQEIHVAVLFFTLPIPVYYPIRIIKFDFKL